MIETEIKLTKAFGKIYKRPHWRCCYEFITGNELGNMIKLNSTIREIISKWIEEIEKGWILGKIHSSLHSLLVCLQRILGTSLNRSHKGRTATRTEISLVSLTPWLLPMILLRFFLSQQCKVLYLSWMVFNPFLNLIQSVFHLNECQP